MTICKRLFGRGAILLLLPMFLTACPGQKPVVTNETLPDVAAIRTRAEGGDPFAQQELGTIYAKGLVVTQSYVEAARWYHKAAAQSNAAAWTALGELYEVGQGVARDETAAANWYRLAAAHGHPSAQYSLAALYVMGKGVSADDAEALKWYRRAAEQNDALSQYTLGMRYYEGRGVAQDQVQAYQWLRLAAVQGISDAILVSDALKKKMTREQLAEGQRLVSAFTSRQTPGAAR